MSAETCLAEFREERGDHTHGCDDYADHSAGSHHCDVCGLLWGALGGPHCCLCGARGRQGKPVSLESTDLPGGWRCADHDACREHLRATIAAHVGLAEVCE